MREEPHTVDSRNAFANVATAGKPAAGKAVYFPPQQYARLLAGLVHKLNNVITVLSGHTGLLLLQPKLSRSVREPVQQMSDATQLLSRYLDEAVLAARSPRLEPGPVDVVPLLAGLADAGEVPVELTGLPASAIVYGDAQQLRSCFEQTIRNAQEAKAKSVTCTVNDLGDHWQVDFRDDGHGISVDVINRIFEPFFTTRKDRNIGLGLFRIQGYLALTGGGLAVTSDGKTYTEARYILPKTAPGSA